MALSPIQPKLSRISSRKRQLEKDLEHITQEMYQRNRELVETNRTLTLLRTIDSLVLESHDSIQNLCQQIADAISKTAEYPLVAILGPPHSRDSKLDIYGLSASSVFVDAELINMFDITTKHSWFKSDQRSKLISLTHVPSDKIAYYLGLHATSVDGLRSKLPLKSIYIVRLLARQKLVGVMAIGLNTLASEVEAAEGRFLDRLSEAVGIALDNKLLFEENQQVLSQIKKANIKLKELDQTKDEFISMASHQLRTPLTTIKGYLSMVLEGDVGPVSKDEKKMIQQAFDSAEHMVFLIADLLNVSRLQSGKFVIENKPTDLVKMVEAETAQLQDTAKNHQLTLTFQKPDKFPVVNLDETKIRQVVMNFMDNAIYYTPAGGSIVVALEASNHTINYTVTDTGLGVPKSEQHHLFSKFYRAGNARKMRPDGTGLGLYMAKKVISAQAGAIIFKSTEGKGSIFGFSFPRSKVEVK